jgi:hypothetical protein
LTYEILKNNVGKQIALEGHVSDVMWQHLMKYNPEYPRENYFDLPGNLQIVAYSKDSLPKNRQIQIIGQIIEIRGGSKRPQEKLSKVDETYVEYHILVNSWKYVGE